MADDPTLRIVLEGNLGDITVEALIRALDGTVAILNQLDVVTAGQSMPSLTWYVTGLTEGSAAVEMRARPKTDKRRRQPADQVDLARALVAGLHQLENRDDVPERFVDTSVRRVGTLGRILSEGATGLRIEGPPPANPDDHRPRTAHVSLRSARHSQQATKVATRSRSSLVGNLEKLDVHRRHRFGIYNTRSRRAVMCEFAPDQLDEVVAALGRRVLVDGILSRNPAGDPLRIVVGNLDVLPDDADLPPVQAMFGSAPDFTHGMTVAQRLDEIREA